MVKKTEIRVRLAPSPSGNLHVGTARTALFNWLFARKHDGRFILRIEDTNKENSKPEFEKNILSGLAWLGLTWDEGPYRQSARTGVYRPYIRQLIDEKKAYYCFCAKDDIDSERKKSQKAKRPYVYNQKCRALSQSEILQRKKDGQKSVIRIMSGRGAIAFEDIIRGNVSFQEEVIGDIVIARDEKTPLYNLAVVIDDYEMKISHIIRGEDHIANTPKQIMIQRALHIPTPVYAHHPLFLNPDRSKMSKRKQAVAVLEYRDQGYLPEAMLNFIALLGWHPKDNQEIFTKEELVKLFRLEDIQKGGAVFDLEKLKWFNGRYIRALSNPQLLELLKLKVNTRNEKILMLVKERLKTLSEFKELTDFIYKLPDYKPELLIWKSASKDKTKENLRETYNLLNTMAEEEFTAAAVPGALVELLRKSGTGAVLWPLRVAFSGQKASPGPYEILEVLGKKESLRRLDAAIKKITNPS